MVFTSFPTALTPRLDSWRSHLAAVLGEPTAGSAMGGASMSGASTASASTARDADADSKDADANATVWHLVSSNNRTIARSAVIFGRTATAIEDALHLVESGDELQVRLVSVPDRATYGWYGTLNGIAAITCARWFATERDRRESIELAIASLPIATHGSAARQLSATATGRRG